VLKDLDPSTEMAAVDRIEQLHAEGRIKIVTSKMSKIEQARAKEPAVRTALVEHSNDVSMVQADHRLLGFNNIDYGQLGFISNPIITDIVNDTLFAQLGVAGLKDADAKHVMHAVENDCQVFVTLDNRDLLPQRVAVEAVCGGMRILKPTELVAEFAGQ
jgi:hypothetical protein